MILGFWAAAGDWIGGILESFFLMIDNVIYSFIEQVYELFILISEAGVFSQNTIQQFAGRVYVFLGLIMLFVVSISLVQYILDPKKFSDSKIGGAKLVKDFAFVLIAIIAIPYVFEAAFRLQRIVLKDNIIGSLILGMKYTGQETDEKDNPSYYATYGGKIMAYSAASAFVTFNPEVASYACINQPINDAGALSEACSNLGGLKYDGGYNSEGGKIENFGDYVVNYSENKDFRYLLNKNYVSFEVENEETGTVYKAIDYSFLMSTIAGGFIVYILLGFCIDIAVRSVKLSFLQLIAPIPLMMKIIPGSGQKKFDAWVKQCVSTYCEIFVKLAAIYFAIFIIAAITTDGIQNVGGSGFVQTTLVRVAIIFGALMFASELPKLLKDILGGSGGNFKLGGPMKKIMSNPIAGAATGAAVGGLASTAANLYHGGKNMKDNWSNPENKGFWKKTGQGLGVLGSGIGGAASGMILGGKTGYSGKNSLYKTMSDTAEKTSFKRNSRDEGYGFKEKFNKEKSRMFGLRNTAGTFGETDAEIARYNNQYSDALAFEKRSQEIYADDFSDFMKSSGGEISSSDLMKIDEREIVDKNTGAFGNRTAAAEDVIKRLRENQLNYQKFDDNINTAQSEYETAIEKQRQYNEKVNSGEVEANAEEERKFNEMVKASNDKLAHAQQEKLEKYDKVKELSTKFEQLIQSGNIRNDANTTSIINKKALDKANARKERNK